VQSARKSGPEFLDQGQEFGKFFERSTIGTLQLSWSRV